MKLSRYNYTADIDEEKKVMYNTLTRKYVVLDEMNESLINVIFEKLNDEQYDLQEVKMIKELFSKGILINEEFDELEQIKFNESIRIFQEQTFNLTIQPTLDCNFRCVYCYEEHRKKVMDDYVAENIIKLVEDITRKVKNLNVMWFGGEPMMEISRISTLTKEMQKICRQNNCNYKAVIVSNGYLFNDNIIEELKELSIARIQITLDGNEKYHDRQRPLIGGAATFNKVKENILKLIENDFNVTVRINVSEDNYDGISEVFDIIPFEKRKKVIISMCNLFQNKGKISIFDLYKESIEKGYPYFNVSNSLVICRECTKNSITVEPDGVISPCSYASEDGCKLGKLSSNGKLEFKDKSTFLKLKNLTIMDNENCKKCIKLPLCMGGCRYARYKDGNYCNQLRPDGMTLDEKIKLQYYNDLKLHVNKN